MFHNVRRMQQTLEERAKAALTKDFSPSGSKDCPELIETQLENEENLEALLLELIDSYGPAHAISIQVFFHLFDVLIGLYRLNKCDSYLNIFREGCCATTQTSSNRIKWFQSLAFTRWKQGKFQDAIYAFKEIEDLMQGDPSAALYENMAHTYSSMGQYENAKEYFQRSITASGDDCGGTLLGLGLLHERTGDVDQGIALVTRALQWYEARFGAKGNESSLEAKCCLSLSKMYIIKSDMVMAAKLADRALDIFRRTCGNDSPLVSGALRVKAEIHSFFGEHGTALDVLLESLEIETRKDAIDLVAIVENIQHLTVAMRQITSSSRDHIGCRIVDRVEKACLIVTNRVSLDGNIAAVFKFAAELAIYANRLSSAKKLLEDALPLFEVETSMDCSSLVEQCKELIHILDTRLV